MDNLRLVTWGLFGLLAWFTYQQWVEDYAPRTETSAPAQDATDEPVATDADAMLPEIGDEAGLPDVTAGTDTDDALPTVQGAGQEAAPAAPATTVIRVTTDVATYDIDTRGGTLRGAVMRNYPVSKDDPDTKVSLLGTSADDLGTVTAGVTSGAGLNNDIVFSAARTEYALGDANELTVVLRHEADDGVTIEKRFRFGRGQYAIDVEQLVINDGEAAWAGRQYTQMQRRSFEQERSMFDVDSYSFDGALTYDGDKAEKRDRDDLLSETVEYRSDAGWFATIQHHFLVAAIPPRGEPFAYRVNVRDTRLTAVIAGGRVQIAPGARHSFNQTIFVGPKLQDQLETIDETLKLSVDYGWLTILSQPMFWLLSTIFDFVGNWGVAIILVTVIIKLVFYKLTESSGRSMAKMRKLQPRMKALQERYKDDRQALSQQMMELYKREKVNPAAGCLPILIQMPFFLAFYWVLVESVEMRQAPFALWLTDLSSRDPYFILPLIMGAAMLLQTRLNPAPADPVQARVMQIMPVVFTGFFAFFPSGLVLYWVTNTLLSIAQQWKINRVVEAEDRKKRRN